VAAVWMWSRQIPAAYNVDEVYEAVDEEDHAYEHDDEAYHEELDYEAEEHYDGPTYDGAESFLEDEALDSFLQDFLGYEENSEVADALATVTQYRKKGKGKGKDKGSSSSSGSQQSRLQVTFHLMKKLVRNNAVKFLKSVTSRRAIGLEMTHVQTRIRASRRATCPRRRLALRRKAPSLSSMSPWNPLMRLATMSRLWLSARLSSPMSL